MLKTKRQPEIPELEIDAVLIDDDLLVHATWLAAANRVGKKLIVFKNVAEFLEIISLLPRSTPIYIDSDLKTEVRGEFAAEDFYAQGFKEIYLVTGYAPETFGRMPWIRSILGKRPIWV